MSFKTLKVALFIDFKTQMILNVGNFVQGDEITGQDKQHPIPQPTPSSAPALDDPLPSFVNFPIRQTSDKNLPLITKNSGRDFQPLFDKPGQNVEHSFFKQPALTLEPSNGPPISSPFQGEQHPLPARLPVEAPSREPKEFRSQGRNRLPSVTVNQVNFQIRPESEIQLQNTGHSVEPVNHISFPNFPGHPQPASDPQTIPAPVRLNNHDLDSRQPIPVHNPLGSQISHHVPIHTPHSPLDAPPSPHNHPPNLPPPPPPLQNSNNPFANVGSRPHHSGRQQDPRVNPESKQHRKPPPIRPHPKLLNPKENGHFPPLIHTTTPHPLFQTTTKVPEFRPTPAPRLNPVHVTQSTTTLTPYTYAVYVPDYTPAPPQPPQQYSNPLQFHSLIGTPIQQVSFIGDLPNVNSINPTFDASFNPSLSPYTSYHQVNPIVPSSHTKKPSLSFLPVVSSTPAPVPTTPTPLPKDPVQTTTFKPLHASPTPSHVTVERYPSPSPIPLMYQPKGPREPLRPFIHLSSTERPRSLPLLESDKPHPSSPPSSPPHSHPPTEEFEEPIPPAHPPFQPIHPELQPVHSEFQPVHPQLPPVHPVHRPVHPEFQPVHPELQPVHPEFQPVHPKFQPVHPELQPVHPTSDIDAVRSLPFQSTTLPPPLQQSTPSYIYRPSTPPPYVHPSPGPVYQHTPNPYYSPSPTPFYQSSPIYQSTLQPLYQTTPVPFRHSTPIPNHHSTPTPFHQSTPAAFRHSTPSSYHHSTPGPFHYSTQAPFHHPTQAPFFHSTPSPFSTKTPYYLPQQGYPTTTPYPSAVYFPVQHSPRPPRLAVSPSDQHPVFVPSPTENFPSPTENEPSPTETVSSLTENVSSLTENVLSPSENVPSPTENVSSPTENVSSPTENVSSPTENVPSPTENVLSPTESIPSPSSSKKNPSPTEIIPSPSTRVPIPSENVPNPIQNIPQYSATWASINGHGLPPHVSLTDTQSS